MSIKGGALFVLVVVALVCTQQLAIQAAALRSGPVAGDQLSIIDKGNNAGELVAGGGRSSVSVSTGRKKKKKKKTVAGSDYCCSNLTCCDTVFLSGAGFYYTCWDSFPSVSACETAGCFNCAGDENSALCTDPLYPNEWPGTNIPIPQCHPGTSHS